MNEEQEYHRRIKTLKLEDSEKEELHSKFKIALENDFKCFYCGEKMDIEYESELSFTIDHIIPKSKGGEDTANNLEFVCRNCNFLKGEKDVDYFLENLDRLKQRKLKSAMFKARRVKDDRIKESYAEIFKLRGAR